MISRGRVFAPFRVVSQGFPLPPGGMVLDEIDSCIMLEQVQFTDIVKECRDRTKPVIFFWFTICTSNSVHCDRFSP